VPELAGLLLQPVETKNTNGARANQREKFDIADDVSP
jgi:hypothetical protein